MAGHGRPAGPAGGKSLVLYFFLLLIYTCFTWSFHTCILYTSGLAFQDKYRTKHLLPGCFFKQTLFDAFRILLPFVYYTNDVSYITKNK